MTLEERADLIAGHLVLTASAQQNFSAYALHHLREAVAEIQGKKKMELQATATLKGGPWDGEVVKVLGPCYVRYVERPAGQQPPWPAATYAWGFDDAGNTIGVFKGVSPADEVQPLVPDKAAPADLFRLIREKRKAMEEVQPTAIVEAQEPRPKNSFELIQTDIRCNLQDYIQPPPNPEARP